MSFSRSIIRLLMPAVLLALAAVITAAPVSALPVKDLGGTLEQMLDAIQTNKYDQFIAGGDASFQNGFTQQKFDGLAKIIAPRLHDGYYVTFLTTLRQQDYLVYLWKLTFKDAKDELLVHLAVRNGYVIGFITR